MFNKTRVIIGLLVMTTLIIGGCSGKRGLKGDAGTVDCVQCHSDNTTIVAIAGQWDHSIHATGGNFERSTQPCANCHTTEGFVAIVSGDSIVPANPSPVGCFGCHEPHTNKNFNLRTVAPVTLELGGTFDHGEGNLCANCHQGRAFTPTIPAETDSVSLTSSRWGPHHGPQGNILNGSGAYVFSGSTYRNSPHTTQVTNGCPTCHMATPYGFQAGGHTMAMTYDSHGSTVDNVAGCNSGTACHSGLTDFNVDSSQDSVETLMLALQASLISHAYLDSTTLLVKASTSHPLRITGKDAGAVFNYLFFEADRSLGVHNTKYAMDALNASITALAVR